MNRLTKTIAGGLVASCHDCSDGGMAVSLAEMAFAGGFGMDIRLDPTTMPVGQEALPGEKQLFSESNTRFIVEVADEKKFIRAMKGLPVWRIGTIRKDKIFTISDRAGKQLIKTEIGKLKAAWQNPFKDL
jgi:phosphoribosylformylglycinamidine synthase